MTKDILVIGGGINLFYNIQKHFINEIMSISYVGSAEEGLLKMQLNNYCLIILDLLTDKESMQKTIAAIRKQKSMPILVLTEKWV